MTFAEFRLQGDPASVRAALAEILDAPLLRGCSDAVLATVELVLAEVLNNIAEHAYAGGGGPIALHLDRGAAGLRCRIEDRGAPMPGNRLPAGGLPPAEALADGGYGWHLIRSQTRNLRYERRGAINRLTFILPAEQ